MRECTLAANEFYDFFSFFFIFLNKEIFAGKFHLKIEITAA